MTPIQFVKMQGLGNDFIVVDCIRHSYNVKSLIAQAAALCNRRIGIGADGLILVMAGHAGNYRMRIINSDGSEPEMCGNGIRCFAKFVFEHGLTQEKTFIVETLAGPIIPVLTVVDGVVTRVCVDMGEPRLERAEIPMQGADGQVVEEPLRVEGQTLNVTAVSMGNPHAVFFVDNVKNCPVQQLGPIIETLPVFPKKINVEFVEVLSPTALKMRVWERGAGITLACGTGACATLVAAVLAGKSERAATVTLPGGSLQINWSDKDNHVYMTGPAQEVFSGHIGSGK